MDSPYPRASTASIDAILKTRHPVDPMAQFRFALHTRDPFLDSDDDEGNIDGNAANLQSNNVDCQINDGSTDGLEETMCTVDGNVGYEEIQYGFHTEDEFASSDSESESEYDVDSDSDSDIDDGTSECTNNFSEVDLAMLDRDNESGHSALYMLFLQEFRENQAGEDAVDSDGDECFGELTSLPVAELECYCNHCGISGNSVDMELHEMSCSFRPPSPTKR
jgi:hypothetical protein